MEQNKEEKTATCQVANSREFNHSNLEATQVEDGNKIYEDEEWVFIWGIPSIDEPSAKSNLHTLNDIEVLFNKKKQEYFLSIETIYRFFSVHIENVYNNLAGSHFPLGEWRNAYGLP